MNMNPDRKRRHVALGGGALVLALALTLAAGQSRTSRFDGIVTEVSREYGVPAKLIHSIIRAESDYDPNAVSHKGAMGLMQLMPATARQYGVRDPFDPVQNIHGGVRYIKDLMRLYDKKTNLVLAAYNAGQEAVRKYGGIPPYRETINYIDKIKRTYRKAYISSGTEIYKYVNENGVPVLTNNYLEYKQHLAKKKNKKNRKSIDSP
jgi:soluble lytic murein transglycosylase-like protein